MGKNYEHNRRNTMTHQKHSIYHNDTTKLPPEQPVLNSLSIPGGHWGYGATGVFTPGCSTLERTEIVCILFDPAIPFFCIYRRHVVAHVPHDTCMRGLRATLLVSAKSPETTTCPPTTEQIGKVRYNHRMQ